MKEEFPVKMHQGYLSKRHSRLSLGSATNAGVICDRLALPKLMELSERKDVFSGSVNREEVDGQH